MKFKTNISTIKKITEGFYHMTLEKNALTIEEWEEHFGIIEQHLGKKKNAFIMTVKCKFDTSIPKVVREFGREITEKYVSIIAFQTERVMEKHCLKMFLSIMGLTYPWKVFSRYENALIWLIDEKERMERAAIKKAG
jgi:hypothetical protein